MQLQLVFAVPVLADIRSRHSPDLPKVAPVLNPLIVL
jgi:hypothetical protein